MKRASLIFVFLASALAACGDNGTDTGGDDAPNPDDPMPDPPRVVDAAGNYRIHSTFDIATTMPGAQGTFVNGLIAATDDPNDPMLWVLDQMIGSMQPGTFKTVLETAKPFVAGYLNDQVTLLAPELVNTLLEVGHRMADLTKHFGVEEQFSISEQDQALLAQITADGARFKVGASYVDAPFYAHDIDDVMVFGVHVTHANGHLALADHSLPLPYGKLMRIGLDIAVIPAIDPSATSLADLLDNLVDCQAVGNAIAGQVPVGNGAFWKSVCLAGLSYAANKIYDQILASDALLDFHRTGTSRAADSNSDYKLDKLTFGEWSGTADYDGSTAPLAQPATYTGERM